MQEMHLSFREIAHTWGTTAMGAFKFVENHDELKIPEKRGKSYKITPDEACNILSARGIHPPRKVIGLHNCKGGVGKTSMTHSLASLNSMYFGSKKGNKTLIIDLDFQGNLTTSFGISKKVGVHKTILDAFEEDLDINKCITPVTESLDIVPANSDLELLDNKLLVEQVPLDIFFENLIGPVRDEYSCIFVDCPPRTNPPTIALNLYADIMLLVSDMDEFSKDGIETMFKHMSVISKRFKDKLKSEPKIFLNKFDAREKSLFSIVSELKSSYGECFLNSYISTCGIVKSSFNKGNLLWNNPRTHNYFKDVIDLYLEIFDPEKNWQKKYH